MTSLAKRLHRVRLLIAQNLQASGPTAVTPNGRQAKDLESKARASKIAISRATIRSLPIVSEGEPWPIAGGL